MKKNIYICAALVAAVVAMQPVSSNAAIAINFDTTAVDLGRIYDTQANATLAGTTGRLPIGTIVQLIWSSDTTAGALNPLNPLTPTGGDITINNGVDNYWTLNFAGRMSYSVSDTDALLGGYVYVRVFNSLTTGGIGAGTMYLEAPVWSAVPGALTLAGPLVAQTSDPATTLQLDITPGGANIWLNQTIVPEPSVLAFLGIGAAFLAVRRMRRS